MSALTASWHVTLRDASQEERLEIFCFYRLVLVVVSSFIGNYIVWDLMDEPSKRNGRYGILRWTTAIALATFEGLMVSSFIAAYIVFPSLIAGRFLPPACAARCAREDDDSSVGLPCLGMYAGNSKKTKHGH